MSFSGVALAQNSVSSVGVPQGVATFESIGISLSYEGDDNNNSSCGVEYRVSGAAAWREGYPLWADRAGKEFRGSVVLLQPATTYEVRLTCTDADGGGGTASLEVTTWSEEFPIGRVEYLPAGVSNTPLVINESGTPTGYVLYTYPEGDASTIDVANAFDNNITISGSYIIIRGLTLRGAARDAILLGDVHDIVIEDNDIAGWGRQHADGWGYNMDAAVYSNASGLARLVLQRNTIHHPRTDANNWGEYRDYIGGTHPAGPQAVTLYNTEGNHVIRYNHVYSDTDHYFNDVFGGGSNGSVRGFPNANSDLYGNIVANCWDDGIESEGANNNVRIWGNYITDCFIAVATRSTSIGPMYIWRNVFGASRRSDLVPWDDDPRGSFHKAGWIRPEWGDHGVHVFHNTTYQPAAPAGSTHPLGAGGGIVGDMDDTTSRNNVFHVYRESAYSIRAYSVGASTFDYDLYSGRLGGLSEANGIFGTPVYEAGHGFDGLDSTGVFTLAPASPGYDEAVALPNFNDDFQGAAPDMGAHEAGTAPMRFGPLAAQSGVLAIDTPSLPDGEVGVAYAVTLTGSGGEPPYAWSVASGSLPAGLTLAPDGVLSGVPADAGTWAFEARVTDALDVTAERGLSLAVVTPMESTVAFTGAPVVVDGRLDEFAHLVPVTFTAGDNECLVRLLWDDANLYVAMEVSDTRLHAVVASGASGSVWRDDAVEVMFDLLHDGGDVLAADDRKYIVNVNGAVFESHPGVWERAVVVLGTVGDDTDDQGYRVELALPWTLLGATPVAGMRIGADFAVDDLDDEAGTAYTTADWMGLASYQVPGAWGDLVLVSDGGAPRDASVGSDASLGRDAGPDAGASAPVGEGCGCVVAGGSSAPLWPLVLFPGAIALHRFRRRS